MSASTDGVGAHLRRPAGPAGRCLGPGCREARSPGSPRRLRVLEMIEKKDGHFVVGRSTFLGDSSTNRIILGAPCLRAPPFYLFHFYFRRQKIVGCAVLLICLRRIDLVCIGSAKSPYFHTNVNATLESYNSISPYYRRPNKNRRGMNFLSNVSDIKGFVLECEDTFVSRCHCGKGNRFAKQCLSDRGISRSTLGSCKPDTGFKSAWSEKESRLNIRDLKLGPSIYFDRS